MKNFSLINIFISTRRTINLGISKVDAIFQRKNLITIYSYHSISDDNWFYGVSRKEFEKQIKYLLRHYQPLTLKDVEDFIRGKTQILKPSFVITFDDGYEDNLEVTEFLSNLNIKPTLFLLSNPEEVNRDELHTDKQLMNISSVNKLKKVGWTFGSHGATHTDFKKITPAKQADEILGSKKDLEKTLKQKVNYFAYPRGRYSKSIVKNVEKADYKLALTMDDGFITEKTNKLLLPRIGINRSHGIDEFSALASPLVIQTRSMIKALIKGAL